MVAYKVMQKNASIFLVAGAIFIASIILYSLLAQEERGERVGMEKERGLNTEKAEGENKKTGETESKEVSRGNKEGKVAPPSFLAVASDTLDWLDKRKDDRGAYTFGQSCLVGSDDRCFPEASVHREGFSALWGRFWYSQATDDSAQLEKLLNELSVYGDPNIVKVIQNNFWNCLFLKDLGESGVFTGKDLENVERICLDSTYDGGGFFLDTQNKNAAYFLNEQIVELIHLVIDGENVPGDSKEGSWVSSYAGDRASRYLWKREKEDLLAALTAFRRALARYGEGRMDLAERCVLGTSSLVTGKAIQQDENEYKEFARFLAQNVFQEALNADVKSKTLCAFFADQMSDATGDSQYAKERDDLLLNLIRNSYDNARWSQKIVRGEGGFFQEINEGRVMEKLVKYNGMLAGLLAKTNTAASFLR